MHQKVPQAQRQDARPGLLAHGHPSFLVRYHNFSHQPFHYLFLLHILHLYLKIDLVEEHEFASNSAHTIETEITVENINFFYLEIKCKQFSNS